MPAHAADRAPALEGSAAAVAAARERALAAYVAQQAEYLKLSRLLEWSQARPVLGALLGSAHAGAHGWAAAACCSTPLPPGCSYLPCAPLPTRHPGPQKLEEAAAAGGAGELHLQQQFAPAEARGLLGPAGSGLDKRLDKARGRGG